MKNVFATSWLPAPAEYILRAILKQDFDLSDANVKGAWCKLCSDLVAAGLPGILALLSVQDDREPEIEVKRQLWTVLAKRLLSPEDRSTWQDIVSFLDIAFGWVFKDLLLTVFSY
jgi:hypothetical protein